jgi:polysaccharide pyruvyl transferase WcaK-like protein
MRVLVLWADNASANLGVRVLAQGAERVAKQAFGEESVVSFQDLGPNADGFRISTDLIKSDLGRRHGPIKTWLRNFDVVLDTGAGDSFTDIYGRNRLARIVYTQLTARRLGLPLVFLPQTIGPFDNVANRIVAGRSLRRANLVFARDPASAAYARRLGVKRVATSTDLVFSLPTVSQPKSRDVIVNVSGLLWNSNKHVDAERYRRATRSLLSSLRDNGRQVTIMPHVIQNRTSDNDMLAVDDLHSELGDIEIAVPGSLDEARTVLATAQTVVGARMHACLNALSVGTPAIPWAYSRKFAPLLDEIGWRHTIDLRVEQDPVRRTMAAIDRSSGIDEEVALVNDLARLRIGELEDALRTLKRG